MWTIDLDQRRRWPTALKQQQINPRTGTSPSPRQWRRASPRLSRSNLRLRPHILELRGVALRRRRGRRRGRTNNSRSDAPRQPAKVSRGDPVCACQCPCLAFSSSSSSSRCLAWSRLASSLLAPLGYLDSLQLSTYPHSVPVRATGSGQHSVTKGAAW